MPMNRTRGGICVGTLAILLNGGVTARVLAQTFNSGSTGADGALDLSSTPSGTTVLFDPGALGIDPERDNVFHFTTITIPAGVTVRLSESILHGPVFWLASGAVLIAGTVDLNGQRGHASTESPASRTPADAGAGGFFGGLGGNLSGTGQPGSGPAGGAANLDAGHGAGGGPSGNQFLVPLFGGSGGGGGHTGGAFTWASGGGSGGGAILIASSVSIVVSGSISANGGRGGVGNSDCFSWWAGSGSGGAIRLVAPVLRGNGTLSVQGGPMNAPCTFTDTTGATGRLRLEAFVHEFTGSRNGNWTTGSPISLFLPASRPRVAVVSIDGIPVPPDPTGSFDVPDVTISKGTPVTFRIEARFIPVDPTGKAAVKLHLFSLEGPDQIVAVDAPLSGTFESSSTSATVTLPPGFTRGFVRAVWR